MGPSARRALLMTAIASAAALAGCSGSGGPVFAPPPDWQSGFAWTYSTSLELAWADEEGIERDNGTERSRWREVHEVLNTTQSADGEAYYVVATQQSGDREAREVQLVRHRDLHELPFRSSSGSSCNHGVCTYQFQVKDVNMSGPTFLDFPLERGERWGDVFMHPHLETKFVYQAEVDGSYEVETGLGTMEAARVAITVQPVNNAALRQEIMQDAQEAGYQVDALELLLSERQLVYYSADYQAIVRTDVLGEEMIYARGSGPDGQPFEFREESRRRLTSVLEGARLVPRPERSLEEVGAFLAGQLALRDPTGQAIGEASYKLSIDPPRATINVGVGETARFTAVVNGTLPDDHGLRWTMVGEQGQTLSSGAGSTFEAAPERPGRYVVEVESMVDNQTVAAAGALLTGHWDVTQTVDCGPVSAFAACVTQDIPVHPGARSLFVRVTPDEAVDGLVDEMYVEDSAGTRITGTDAQGAWTVELEPIEGYLVDADPWSLDFTRGVAGPSSAQVEVRVLYGGQEAAGTEPAPVRTPFWHWLG